jgi:hypothetical protein
MKIVKFFPAILLALGLSCPLFGQVLPESPLSDEEMVEVAYSHNDTLGFQSLTEHTTMVDFRGRKNRELRRTMRRIVELLDEDMKLSPYILFAPERTRDSVLRVIHKRGKKMEIDFFTYMVCPKYRSTPAGVEIICIRACVAPWRTIDYKATVDYIFVGPDGAMKLVKTIEVDNDPRPKPVGRVALHDYHGGPVQYVFPETTDKTAEQIPPQFNSETGEFAQYMLEHIEYPSYASENHIQSMVAILFFIGADGSIYSFDEIQSAASSLTKEVERCIRQTEGMWTPGTVNGVPTPVEVIFGIDFRLDDPPIKREKTRTIVGSTTW